MDLTAFLVELEGITHRARQGRLVELGRASLSDPDMKALVDALKAGDAYARSLAVTTIYGSRDGALALELALDTSRTCGPTQPSSSRSRATTRKPRALSPRPIRLARA